MSDAAKLADRIAETVQPEIQGAAGEGFVFCLTRDEWCQIIAALRQSALLDVSRTKPEGKPWPFTNQEVADFCGVERFRLESRRSASNSFAIGEPFATSLISLLGECERRLATPKGGSLGSFMLIEAALSKVPLAFALRWCEPGPLGCACMGCANGPEAGAGNLAALDVTKREWQEWKAVKLGVPVEDVADCPPGISPGLTNTPEGP